MSLLKAGQPGPKVIPRAKGPSCDATADVLPWVCYGYVAMLKDGGWMGGSRATTMAQIPVLIVDHIDPPSEN